MVEAGFVLPGAVRCDRGRVARLLSNLLANALAHGAPDKPVRVRAITDGETFELGPGGLCHVESTTPRRFWNAGEEDLVLLVVGGAGGYVGRDGHMVDPADEERRRAFSAGVATVIQALGP